MSFADDIAEDFRTILSGEFSRRIVFHILAGDWDTVGIFDETFEEIPGEEGGQATVSQEARVTVYYADRPADLPHRTPATVYASDGTTVSGSFVVHDVQDESEGNALVRLRRDP